MASSIDPAQRENILRIIHTLTEESDKKRIEANNALLILRAAEESVNQGMLPIQLASALGSRRPWLFRARFALNRVVSEHAEQTPEGEAIFEGLSTTFGSSQANAEHHTGSFFEEGDLSDHVSPAKDDDNIEDAIIEEDDPEVPTKTKVLPTQQRD